MVSADRATPPSSPRTGPVAGIVLAAGASSRMGANKLLLALGGEPLVRRAARTAIEAGLDPTLVVLGHEAERVEAALAGLACRAVTNPDHRAGMGASLRAGILAVPAEAIAAVVVLADMPLVTAEMMARLVREFRRGTAPLVVSEYQPSSGEPVLAPPTLFGRALFAEIAAGGPSGKAVAERHRKEAEVVTWPVSALADLDLPEDYRRVRRDIDGG